MNDARFDHLTGVVGNRLNRRQTVGLLGLTGLTALTKSTIADAKKKKRGNKKCRPACKTCYRCLKGTCKPARLGTSCGGDKYCVAGDCISPRPPACLEFLERCDPTTATCCPYASAPTASVICRGRHDQNQEARPECCLPAGSQSPWPGAIGCCGLKWRGPNGPGTFTGVGTCLNASGFLDEGHPEYCQFGLSANGRCCTPAGGGCFAQNFEVCCNTGAICPASGVC